MDGIHQIRGNSESARFGCARMRWPRPRTWAPRPGNSHQMGIPTVLMVGTEHLSNVPEYLRLGSVVVIGPTLDRLTQWQEERPVGPRARSEPGEDVHVDLLGRRVWW